MKVHQYCFSSRRGKKIKAEQEVLAVGNSFFLLHLLFGYRFKQYFTVSTHSLSQHRLKLTDNSGQKSILKTAF